MENKSQEEILSEILTKPEIRAAEKVDNPNEEAAKAVDEAFPGLAAETRKILAKAMTAKMPTPEQLIKAQQNAVHNAEIQRKRDARLAARRARQKINGKKRNRRKNHG